MFVLQIRGSFFLRNYMSKFLHKLNDKNLLTLYCNIQVKSQEVFIIQFVQKFGHVISEEE